MKVTVRRVMPLVMLPTVMLSWGCSEGGYGPADDTNASAAGSNRSQKVAVDLARYDRPLMSASGPTGE